MATSWFCFCLAADLCIPQDLDTPLGSVTTSPSSSVYRGRGYNGRFLDWGPTKSAQTLVLFSISRVSLIQALNLTAALSSSVTWLSHLYARWSLRASDQEISCVYREHTSGYQRGEW